jgi:hypothetical protein
VFNESGIVRPHPTEDPPELQFYRIRCANARGQRGFSA